MADSNINSRSVRAGSFDRSHILSRHAEVSLSHATLAQRRLQDMLILCADGTTLVEGKMQLSATPSSEK